MVTRKEKLKLARKYFIEQKKEEILAFFNPISYLIIFIGLLFYATSIALGIVGILINLYPNLPWEDNIITQLIAKYGLVYLIVNFILWIGIWLNSNWQRAKMRAGL